MTNKKVYDAMFKDPTSDPNNRTVVIKEYDIVTETETHVWINRYPGRRGQIISKAVLAGKPDPDGEYDIGYRHTPEAAWETLITHWNQIVERGKTNLEWATTITTRIRDQYRTWKQEHSS